MAKYESGIKQIPYSQESVFKMLSNLENIEKVKSRIPEDKIENLTFDRDSVSINVPPVGNITLAIVEREEPKCVKFEAKNSPVPFNLWIQMLPVTEISSKIRVTIKADIPLFLRPMIGNKLEDSVDKIADALAMIPYEM